MLNTAQKGVDQGTYNPDATDCQSGLASLTADWVVLSGGRPLGRQNYGSPMVCLGRNLIIDSL